MRRSDLLVLSMRLTEMPCGPLYKRPISLDRESRPRVLLPAAALVGSTTG
jgi:hypothetical protein